MMHRIQLLDPGFDRTRQGLLWSEEASPLKFVIKLHRSKSGLHFDFRLELYGRLISFWLCADYEWDSFGAIKINRTFDHDLAYMHVEGRCIPDGQYGAGPMLVWDYGTYSLPGYIVDPEEIYERLSKGEIEIELKGQRVRGRFHLQGKGETWILERLTLAPFPIRDDKRSVISRSSLDEIEQGKPPEKRPVLWLEWRHFYADNETEQPQVVLKNHQVFDMNRQAALRGIEVGMRKHQFRAASQDCLVKPWAPEPEKAAEWMDLCVPFSGCIEPIDDHIAAVDFSAHPYAIDLVQELHIELKSKDFGDLRTGLGPSKWVARLLAQRDYPLDMSEPIASILAPLPIDFLSPVPEASRERLKFLGYRSIGDVAQIAPSVLQAQFGDGAFAIGQAAQGLLLDEVQALYPKGVVLENHRFAEPIECEETLLLTLKSLANRLAVRLAGQQAGAITLWIEHEDHSVLKLERALKTPIYGVSGIWAVLRTLVDQTPPVKPVTWIRVNLRELEPVQSRQKGLFHKDQSNVDVGFKSLKSAYGSSAILKASEVQVSRRKQVLREWKRATGWE